MPCPAVDQWGPPSARRPGCRFRPHAAHALRMLAVCGAGLPWPLLSQAAGGHHAVDDASILQPGQCQLETWVEQSPGRQLQHAGPACHLVGLEFGLNLDRNSTRDERTTHSIGPQLKWARELQPGLSWGLVWTATWLNGAPGDTVHSVLMPITWSPRSDLTVHVNAGRDFSRRAPSRNRHGIALEWQPTLQWQGIIERWNDGTQANNRIGLRLLCNDKISVDLSRARPQSARPEAWWSLGMNWSFSR